jgi:uncharacterized protein (TIGR03083 family)
MSVDAGDVYRHVRERFVDMLAAQPRSAGRLRVPATPAWTVHDVLAHVIGLTADLNALRFPDDDDPGGDRFAAAQVASRVDRTFEELVAEWGREAPKFEDGLRVFGYEFGSHFVGDLLTHFHDVRAALGLPDDPEPVAVSVALDHYAGFVHERLTDVGEGSLRFVTEERDAVVGADGLIATLTVDAFELLRCLSARRSLAHIRSLPWTGDVDRAIALLERVYSAGYAFPAD